MGAPRHSWEKLREHHYVCRRCATGKVNAQDDRGAWFVTYHKPDGTSVVSTVVTPCEPGRTTAKRLQHYGIEARA